MVGPKQHRTSIPSAVSTVFHVRGHVARLQFSNNTQQLPPGPHSWAGWPSIRQADTQTSKQAQVLCVSRDETGGTLLPTLLPTHPVDGVQHAALVLCRPPRSRSCRHGCHPADAGRAPQAGGRSIAKVPQRHAVHCGCAQKLPPGVDRTAAAGAATAAAAPPPPSQLLRRFRPHRSSPACLPRRSIDWQRPRGSSEGGDAGQRAEGVHTLVAAAPGCSTRHVNKFAISRRGRGVGGWASEASTCMCCVLGRPLHRSTPWPACCRRRSGATLNLLPGPQSVSRDARPRRKSC